jgi:hypothetical protein
MNVSVALSKAERDALRKILRRHGPTMNTFERDLLTQLVRKVQRQRDEELRLLVQQSGRGDPRRFVWTVEDMERLRYVNGLSEAAARDWWPDASSDVDAVSDLLEEQT